MKEILTYMRMKLKGEKGEVSVEWALVAVVMALIILGAFLPGVRSGLDTAMTNISNALGTSSLPATGGGG